MGYFVAYRHTGADPALLEQMLPAIRDTLTRCNVESYCTYFDEAQFQNKKLGPRAIMEHAFQKIEEMGGLLVVIDGPDKSDGQLLEVGYCIAKGIPFVVAKRRSVDNTYVHKMTDNSFEYNDPESLAEGIKKIL